LAVVIPDRSVGDVSLGLGTDDGPVDHRRNLASIRA
jgi:hypothetical protein